MILTQSRSLGVAGSQDFLVNFCSGPQAVSVAPGFSIRQEHVKRKVCILEKILSVSCHSFFFPEDIYWHASFSVMIITELKVVFEAFLA